MSQNEEALLTAFRKMHPEDREVLLRFAKVRAEDYARERAEDYARERAEANAKKRPVLRLVQMEQTKH
jgi:hypothetical protein